jgi:hypothetical protein
LMTWSGADEAGTGTGSDFLRDLLGLLGSLFATTMTRISGSRMRVVKQQGAAGQEGFRGR